MMVGAIPLSRMMKTEISIEFFPPQTPEGIEKLRSTRKELAKLDPSFFSVTYGARGSTRERTFTVVKEIAAEGFDAAPHLSCIGSTRDSIREILNEYKAAGIKRTVALRGDLPSGMAETGEFRYANELVEFIRHETGDHFYIEVAAYPEMHPQALDFELDLQNFARKVQAGSDSAITQYFFNADCYFYFVDRARKLGLDIPIVPGIMPITNSSNLVRFADSCGADIPRYVRKRLADFGDDRTAIREFGFDVVYRLCERLISEGVPAMHFYSMNKVEPNKRLVEALGLA